MAPEALDAGEWRRVVPQPVGDDQRPRADVASIAEPDREAGARQIGVEHRVVADLDRGELGKLVAPAAPQLRRRDAALGEQPPDRVGRGGIGGSASVEHEDALARTAEHEGRAQARRTTADDHGVQHRLPARIPWAGDVAAVPNRRGRSRDGCLVRVFHGLNTQTAGHRETHRFAIRCE